MCAIPYIPEYITVHLAAPATPAQNVTVSFPNYIKNVACSEIYPTWPENSIRANIYAQVSFALNRVYTEWYPSQGYNFQITNSTAYDQSFQYGRTIFQNVSDLVDELFNDYIRRTGFQEPLFAQYCNGSTVTCSGLSQWGSVSLANQGYYPYYILTYYYGGNIELVKNAPISPYVPSYPGLLRRGSRGEAVRTLQLRLNRVARNYPAIPTVSVDGIFGPLTEQAVLTFQRVFLLTQDGLVGKQTWYRLVYLYTSVKRINSLYSEGESLYGNAARASELSLQEEGGKQSEQDVFVLQYFLSVISEFYPTVPTVTVDGIFGEETLNAVKGFQRTKGLTVDGVVGPETWSSLYDSYLGIVTTIPSYYFGIGSVLPNLEEILSEGSTALPVRLLQEILQEFSQNYPGFPSVELTGIYDSATKKAVETFQKKFNLSVTGKVSPDTWETLVEAYQETVSTPPSGHGQFPGRILTVGDSDWTS